MIDCHCHLTYPGLNEIKEKIIEDARNKMDAVITCGYPRDCKEALELSKKHSGFVYLTLGLHPIDIVKMTDEEIEKYLVFIREHAENIVAVGEIGLDYHWFKDEKDNERIRSVFLKCLELAEELKLPTVLHLRKAEQEGFEIIKNTGIKNVNFHCYAGNMTLAKQIIDSGYYISLVTNINHSKNSMDIGKKFPLDRLLTETDSPFLSPDKNNPNVPQNVRLVVEKIAELRRMGFEDVDRITTENAIRFFNISNVLE